MHHLRGSLGPNTPKLRPGGRAWAAHFAFVFGWYKVIIAPSLCFSLGALQHTVHTSIIADSLTKFFFRAPIFRSRLESRSNKNNNTNPISTKCRLQNTDRVQKADWEFILFFHLIRDTIRDNMSSYHLPSVTQSLFRDHLSRLFALLWNIPWPFLDHKRC